jgi:hypothetical protein
VIDQVRTGEEQEDRKATPDNESWKGRKEKKKKIKKSRSRQIRDGEELAS